MFTYLEKGPLFHKQTLSICRTTGFVLCEPEVSVQSHHLWHILFNKLRSAGVYIHLAHRLCLPYIFKGSYSFISMKHQITELPYIFPYKSQVFKLLKQLVVNFYLKNVLVFPFFIPVTINCNELWYGPHKVFSWVLSSYFVFAMFLFGVWLSVLFLWHFFLNPHLSLLSIKQWQFNHKNTKLKTFFIQENIVNFLTLASVDYSTPVILNIFCLWLFHTNQYTWLIITGCMTA